jgi:hypothetical protein
MTTCSRRILACAAVALAATAFAQAPQDPRPLIAAQKEAMAPLRYMGGVWRGPATTVRAGGEKHTITQTERIGAFLDGSVKVIEGRGYDAQGQVTFNALGIISYDPAKKAYSMRSYALGHAGDFPVTLKDRDPVRFFEMKLERVGDTDWPLGVPVPPR